jgi:hypothetical protein
MHATVGGLPFAQPGAFLGKSHRSREPRPPELSTPRPPHRMRSLSVFRPAGRDRHGGGSVLIGRHKDPGEGFGPRPRRRCARCPPHQRCSDAVVRNRLAPRRRKTLGGLLPVHAPRSWHYQASRGPIGGSVSSAQLEPAKPQFAPGMSGSNVWSGRRNSCRATSTPRLSAPQAGSSVGSLVPSSTQRCHCSLCQSVNSSRAVSFAHQRA